MVYPDDLGYWRFVYEASEIQNGITYTQEKIFYILVVERPKADPNQPTDQYNPEFRQGYLKI